jgi:ribosomal protein S7
MKMEKKSFYYRDFYRNADGYYASYWAGKFTNTLMKSGSKHTIERELQNTYVYLKLQYNNIPLEFLLESLEKIKPVFNLKHVIIAGKRKEFPVYLESSKQLRLSIKWLKDVISMRKE